MPIFEYVCQECQHEFETLVFGRDKAKCPKCQSQKLSPQLSVFAVSAKSGAGNTRNTPDKATAKLAALHFYQLSMPAPKAPAP